MRRRFSSDLMLKIIPQNPFKPITPISNISIREREKLEKERGLHTEIRKNYGEEFRKRAWYTSSNSNKNNRFNYAIKFSQIMQLQ